MVGGMQIDFFNFWIQDVSEIDLQKSPPNLRDGNEPKNFGEELSMLYGI